MTSPTSRCRQRPGLERRQAGYTLLVVLAILGLTSVMTAALLGLLVTTIKVSDASNRSNRELQALDAAMDAAINQMRFDPASAGRDACQLVPPVERIESLTFDNGTDDASDDVVVEVECEGSVNSEANSAADQVRLVGAGGYTGAFAWTNWPWPAEADPAELVDSRPNLVHRGPAPLQFESGVTVRNSIAAVRSPSDSPAVGVAGDYVQGGLGPSSSPGEPCGLLAAAGPMRITALQGAADPSCGVPASELLLNDDPTAAIAPFSLPTARPPTLPTSCTTGSVIELNPGRYNTSDLSQLNRILNQALNSSSSNLHSSVCANKTFLFNPGFYVLPGDLLVFDRPSSHFVMGRPLNWDPALGGVHASPAAADMRAQLCDTAQSGVTFVLPPQFRLDHRSGRVSMCPRFSDNPGQPPLPAIYQETSYPNRINRTAWSRPFKPTENVLLPCVNTALDIAPAPTSGRLDVIDGPGTTSRPGQAQFAESARLPGVANGRCRVGRTHTVSVEAVDPRLLNSAMLAIRGFENRSTPSNLITDRRIMVTVRRGGDRICTTAAQPGIGNGRGDVIVDLMTGSCANPRPCGITEFSARCYDPRALSVLGQPFFLRAASTSSSNSAPNAEQRLTSALLNGASLEITQYMEFQTNVFGIPVMPEQQYTIDDVRLITNTVPTAITGSVSSAPGDGVMSFAYDDPAAVVSAAGAANPQMPENLTIGVGGLSSTGTPCVYLLCPAVVPNNTRPTNPFVHTLDLESISVQVPAEFVDLGIDPKLSALRVRMAVDPDLCPGQPDDRCPFAAPIFGFVNLDEALRQSYFGTEVLMRLELETHAGVVCAEARHLIGIDQQLSFDLMDVSLSCGIEVRNMEDLRLTPEPSASGVNHVNLTLTAQVPCLRNYFGNASWSCVNFRDGSDYVVFQVRPPSIRHVVLDVSTDSIAAASATSTVNIDARAPLQSSNSSSFNVFGKVWMPRTNLDVRWNGDMTEGLPLVTDELVVGALGSMVIAPPARSQVNVPDRDRYLVCCDARRATSRRVLIVTRVGSRELQAEVLFTDVVDDASGGTSEYFPGYRVEVLDWQTCDSGRCSRGGP